MKFGCHLSKIHLFLFCLLAASVFGQKNTSPIVLENPSFEGLPQPGQTPTGWADCGQTGETPPDIQPGAFSVFKKPAHGGTYLGLVVRDNETWEGVSQRLPRALEKGECYDFTLAVAQSKFYFSASKRTGEMANFDEPVIFRVFGGHGFCDKKEKLAEIGPISNPNWQAVTLRLSPKKANYTYITMEAHYKMPSFGYNGNVLVDNLSPILPVDCVKKTPPPPKPPVKKTDPKPLEQPEPTPTAQPDPPPPVAEIDKIDRKNIQKGMTIPVEKILFDANKYNIKPGSKAELLKIHKFLTDNPDLKIEIGGHSNGSCDDPFCTSLSENRARAVMDWLVERGILPERLESKGYGKSKPVVPIEKDAEDRKKNQRVEIKILEMNN